MPLWWVEIKHRTIVRAYSRAHAVEEARDALCNIMGEEGDAAEVVAGERVTKLEQVPPEWRGGSLPWGEDHEDVPVEELLKRGGGK